MRANIRLKPWTPIIVVIVVTVFLVEGFDVLDVVLILGGGFIVSYFMLGYIRRKNAVLIDGATLIIKSPFRINEYTIQDISEVFIKPIDTKSLKAVYQGETITLCTEIYDISIEEIKQYLMKTYEHIVEKPQEIKKG